LLKPFAAFIPRCRLATSDADVIEVVKRNVEFVCA
jgi:hypothetical protein